MLKVAALVLLAAVVLLALWALLGRRQPATPPPAGSPTTTEPDLTGVLPQPSGPVEPQPERTGALVAARVWAERFASWSNEDGFTNLEQLADQSTPAVQSFLLSYRAQLEQRYPLASGYYGVTGRALSPVVDSLEGDTAQVTVALQLEQGTSTTPTVSNRTLSLRLVNGGSGWLVDFVKWVE